MRCNAGKALFSQDIAAKQAAELRGTELQDFLAQSAPKSASKKAGMPPSTTSLHAMRLAGDEVTFMRVQLHSSGLLAGRDCWHPLERVLEGTIAAAKVHISIVEARLDAIVHSCNSGTPIHPTGI